MKFTFGTIALLALITFAAFFASGCSLLGYDSGEAERIAQKRQDELQASYDRVKEIDAAVADLREKYEQAELAGDTEAILKFGRELALKLKELDLSKDDLADAENAFNGAVEDWENAQKTGNYLEFFVGSILGIFGLGVPGGFAAKKMVGNRNDALRTTAANVEASFSDNPERLTAFKQRQSAALTTSAAKVLNKARGK